MINPSELEGEVDHSFFDSDCDVGSGSRNCKKKTEKNFNDSEENRPGDEKLHEKQPDITKGGLSPRTGEEIEQLINRSKRAEEKEKSCQSTEEERRRASSVSSVCSASDKDISDSSDSEEDFNLRSKRPNETFMSLLAENREVDYNNVHKQSLNETEEETFSSTTKSSGSKGRSKQSPKRRIRNRRIRSPSPTSTEASVDADSESSCSSVKGRRSLEPSALPRPNKSSLSPGVRRTPVGSVGSVGSAGCRDVPVYCTEESEDTVTDVSPLPSPYSSPRHTLNPDHKDDGRVEQKQEESVPSSGLSKTHQDEESDEDNDDCSFTSESQLRGKLVLPHPGGRNRKNYSFTNDEVRCIDRENQRLFRELSRLSPGPRPGSTAGRKSHTTTSSPLVRLSHSALNRQREQQRIERENLAFLKRLESVKPTPGLRRSQQLADYQRQIAFLGGPSYPVFMSTTKKERSTSKTPSGPRPVSSVHRSSRPVSTTSDSRLVIRSKKTSTARPAWS